MKTVALFMSIIYFAVPTQILASLYRYPRLTRMLPTRISLFLMLFLFFIIACGTIHLLQSIEVHQDRVTQLKDMLSLANAFYLVVIAPDVCHCLDRTVHDYYKLHRENEKNKQKLVNFMEFLCHEIRNPLFAITSTVSFLQDEEMQVCEAESESKSSSKQQEQAICTIGHCANLMSRLVDDVVDLSALEYGRLPLNQSQFELRALLTNVAHSTRLQLLQKDKSKSLVHFNFEMDASVPHLIYSDSVRVSQILYTLTSNACKFTNKGCIDLKVSTVDFEEALHEQYITTRTNEKIELDQQQLRDIENSTKRKQQCRNKLDFFQELIPYFRCTTGPCDGVSPEFLLKEEDPSRFQKTPRCDSKNTGQGTSSLLEIATSTVLRIQVSDTGVGIPPESIEHLLEPYSQSKLSQYRKLGGTGLGLSITVRLIKLLQGTFTVSSAPGQGSTIIVYIPVRKVMTAAATAKCYLKKRLSARSSSWSSSSSSLSAQPSFCDSPLTEESSCATPLEFVQRTSNTLNTTAPSDCCFFSSASKDSFRHNGKATKLSRNESNQTNETGSGTSDSTALSAKSTSSTKSSSSIQPSSSTKSSCPEDKKIATEFSTNLKPKYQAFHFPTESAVVLIVDDNGLNRKILGRMLQNFNVEYDTACNGQEAIDKVSKSRNATSDEKRPYYGLILMDLQMPIMNGCQAIDTLRNEYNITNIPIVALTANALEWQKDAALRAGATEFLTKPILRQDLYSKCQQYLSTPRINTAAIGQKDVRFKNGKCTL